MLRFNVLSQENRDNSARMDMHEGFALFHLPGSPGIRLISGPVQPFSGQGQGFILAPFDRTRVPLIIIPRDAENFNAENPSAIPANLPLYFREISNSYPASREDYMHLVQSCLDNINSGIFYKAVASRCTSRSLPPGFNAFRFFQTIVKAYPNAFTYLVSTKVSGTWIGATPELLLRQDRKDVQTVALAGTKMMQAQNTADESFTEKEINEQGLVTDYVEEVLAKYCVNISRSETGMQQAGSLKHLVTRFSALLKHENEGLLLAKALHPTPAVCGLPLQEAMDFLFRNEKYAREFYSGFLGPVEENKLDLYVNLRCMQLLENKALLYAGAGIVSGSDPASEWKETENKLQTLLRYF